MTPYGINMNRLEQHLRDQKRRQHARRDFIACAVFVVVVFVIIPTIIERVFA